MTDKNIEQYLRTEELYRPVIEEIFGLHDNFETVEQVRGALDAILSHGKIIGRRTALPNCAQDGDVLIEGWQRCVDGGRTQ